MTKYTFDEILEMNDQNRLEYFLEYLDELLSNEYFSYRELVLENEKENSSNLKRKLKLLDYLSRELRNNLHRIIVNKLDKKEAMPSIEQFALFEPSTREYIRDVFQGLFNNRIEGNFLPGLENSLDINVLDKITRKNLEFWPYN